MSRDSHDDYYHPLDSSYSPYHRGFNPLERCYRRATYWVTHMCEGAWVYIMDDFGNAVELPH